ncbi:TetR/AcrR family transcriptional regulator [Streptomyces sp. TS71-3]|uniref:TetR/AcrR family transcriptional regulator n=1 Tax=Streptomyces sp. TS71-3 TaxID=2733862 RepID=UPI001B076BA4|nr:TetR/AcrR family transcriptional regulator [Streptomyces sp. TS71-3]GHJ40539.1 TetR family transcriptional regulator [Streptomyces sp. TS71-3]
MHVHDSHWSAAPAVAPSGVGGGGGKVASGGGRTAPLRVDAQRNLEHVLRAAREVFGELGYGAPMEDVARRARVGVGTVYRRFPSKDVLVRRIAEEETARLADQARAALGEEEEPWSALSRFLRTSVASGAGRLLPPQILSVEVDLEAVRAESGTGFERDGGGTGHAGHGLPQQRGTGAGESGGAERIPAAGASSGRTAPDLRLVGSAQAERRPAGSEPRGLLDEPGARALLDVVGRLVERARTAGELRPDVAVSDVLLVIATAAPALPDAAQQAAASERLLDILLEGLRSRPGRG